MDGIPRYLGTSMDALTPMSTITGYKAVYCMAASAFPRFIPLVASAIGTIMPAKVIVIGVGVVGLQAIATATAGRDSG